jgi:hypothetical protein
MPAPAFCGNWELSWPAGSLVFLCPASCLPVWGTTPLVWGRLYWPGHLHAPVEQIGLHRPGENCEGDRRRLALAVTLQSLFRCSGKKSE